MEQDEKPHKPSIKYFFSLGEVFGYFFRKKHPAKEKNINLKLMHGINKLAIIIFLLALLYMAYRYFFLR